MREEQPRGEAGRALRGEGEAHRGPCRPEAEYGEDHGSARGRYRRGWQGQSLSGSLSPRLPPARCCLCPARPRFAPGVTIEEDNCCGCNAIAIRRHFLDENMTAVDIVYTSCHDAVSSHAGPVRSVPPSLCPQRAAVTGGAGPAPPAGPSPRPAAWPAPPLGLGSGPNPTPSAGASWLSPLGEGMEGLSCEALGRGQRSL